MKRITLLFLLSIPCTCAFTQQVRLQDAINIALKNSLDIEVTRNNLRIAQTNDSYGMAGGLPLVNVTGSDQEQSANINQNLAQKISGHDSSYTIVRNGAASNQFGTTFNGGILLFNGFRVHATKKRLEELELQSREYINSQVQHVIAAVMTGYYDVVRQQGYIKTIDQTIAVAQRKLDIIKAQQSVGMANNADLFQAQLDLNNLLQTRQSQVLVIDQAKTELLRLMTLKSDSAITVEDTIIVDRSIVLGNILDSVRRNPDIIAAADQVRVDEWIERETAALRYPSIRASAGYSYSRNQASAGQVLLNQQVGPYVGLNFTVPIYNGNIYRRQQKAAGYTTRNAGLQEGILDRDYSANAVKTYQAYASAIVQLETAQKNVELGQKLLDLVLQRFQLRQATIVDVTLAQQTFETASYSLINLSYASKAAEIELKRLVSRLSP